jgi:hypothetical protein
MLEAAERADQLLDEGNMAGAETWHRILNAIERLWAKVPAEGEKVHRSAFRYRDIMATTKFDSPDCRKAPM